MISRFFPFGQVVWVLLLWVAPASAQDATAQGIEIFERGEFEEARNIFSSQVQADPNDRLATAYLGLTLVELEEYESAETYLSRAMLMPAGDAVRPRHGALNVALARAYMSRRETDRALTALTDAERLDPENADVPYNRGLIRLSENSFQQAATQFERSLELDPEKAFAHYYAGLAYNGLRQPDRMVEHFQIFLRMAPDAPEAARVRSLMRALR